MYHSLENPLLFNWLAQQKNLKTSWQGLCCIFYRYRHCLLMKFKNSCVLFYTVWVQPGPYKKWCRESVLVQPPRCVYAWRSYSFRSQQWNFIFHAWSEEEDVSSILKYKWMHFQFTTNNVFLKLTCDNKFRNRRK